MSAARLCLGAALVVLAALAPRHAAAQTQESADGSALPTCYALAWIGGESAPDSLPDLLLLDTLPPAPGVASDHLGAGAMHQARYLWRHLPERRIDAVWLRTATSEILLLDPTPTSPVGMVEAALVGEGLLGRASGPAERMTLIRGTRAPCPRSGEDRES
jgi:hypothetical protein